MRRPSASARPGAAPGVWGARGMSSTLAWDRDVGLRVMAAPVERGETSRAPGLRAL